MPNDYDVLVLGAGAAGCVAAATASSRGLKVGLVAKNGSATSQSSGAIDAPFQHGESANALSVLVSLAKSVQLTGRADHAPAWLATEAGTLKPCVMAQRTQFFDLSSHGSEPLFVVGFSGLPSFDSDAVARLLSWSLERQFGRKVQAKAIVCDVKGKNPWRSPLEMARAVDDDPEPLRRVLQSLDPQSTHLIPAVLGLKRFDQFAFTKVYELLAMPHSVPGLRFGDALRVGLSHFKIDVLDGEALSATKVDDRVTSVEVAVGNDMRTLSVGSVILATGRYLSGGFTRTGVRVDRLFGLPLWHEGKMIADLPSRQLTAENILGNHPILRAHLRTDDALRPCDRTMRHFARNLRAAGSALSSRQSLGDAALYGYLSAFHTLDDMTRE